MSRIATKTIAPKVKVSSGSVPDVTGTRVWAATRPAKANAGGFAREQRPANRRQ
jgi:hypothetical protein